MKRAIAIVAAFCAAPGVAAAALAMYAAWDHPGWQEACANSARIAQRCELEIKLGGSFAPVVKIERVDRLSGESVDPLIGASVDRSDGSRAPPNNPSTDQPVNHPPGSTEWFTDFCSRYTLLPFDATKDQASPQELKEQCDRALRELAEAGAVWRYGPQGVTGEIRARLDRELTILAAKNIAA